MLQAKPPKASPRRRRKTAQGLARRARIVLAAAEGLENKALVERVGADASTVGKWRRRFAARGLDGLHDEPRSGAPRRIGGEEIAALVARILEETPPDGTRLRPCALDSATGAIIGQCFPRHRSRAFLAFRRTLEAQIPDDLGGHLVMDNIAPTGAS